MRPKFLPSALLAAACAAGVASLPVTAFAAQRAEEAPPAQGQPPQGQPPQPGAPEAVKAPREEAPPSPKGGRARPALIPEVATENTSFAEVLDFLRDVDPTFQAVVAYAPGASPGPMIQQLRLRNVSAPAVLRLIAQTYPDIEVSDVDEDDQNIWTIRVRSAEQDGGGSFGGGGDSGARVRRITRVYRLTEAIDDAMRDDTRREAAREAVMSLLQAALETSMPAPAGKGGRPAGALPSIKLHEPTETLVFTGTEGQGRLVDEALSTLSPPNGGASDELGKRIKALEETVARLEQALAKAEGAAAGVGGETVAPAAEPPTQPGQPNR